MRKKILLMIVLHCFMLLLIWQSGKAMQIEGVIVPGESVGNITIGENCPDKYPNGITPDCEEKKVTEISITSPEFYVTRSKLRIGNDISDIVRFYGKAEPKIKNITILIEYPNLGIDFELSKREERIVKIRIYQATAMEPSRTLDFYKEQFKK